MFVKCTTSCTREFVLIARNLQSGFASSLTVLSWMQLLWLSWSWWRIVFEASEATSQLCQEPGERRRNLSRTIHGRQNGHQDEILYH